MLWLLAGFQALPALLTSTGMTRYVESQCRCVVMSKGNQMVVIAKPQNTVCCPACLLQGLRCFTPEGQTVLCVAHESIAQHLASMFSELWTSIQWMRCCLFVAADPHT